MVGSVKGRHPALAMIFELFLNDHLLTRLLTILAGRCETSASAVI